MQSMFIDPLDGREKLVLAIPHTTPNAGKVVIYDIENDVVEWEVNLAKLSDWIKPKPSRSSYDC
jgi:type II restriction/modification system DNA methylase subunit YeeA